MEVNNLKPKSPIDKYQHLKYTLTILIAPTMLQNSSFVSFNFVHSTFDNIKIISKDEW